MRPPRFCVFQEVTQKARVHMEPTWSGVTESFTQGLFMPFNEGCPSKGHYATHSPECSSCLAHSPCPGTFFSRALVMQHRRQPLGVRGPH